MHHWFELTILQILQILWIQLGKTRLMGLEPGIEHAAAQRVKTILLVFFRIKSFSENATLCFFPEKLEQERLFILDPSLVCSFMHTPGNPESATDVFS